jgi:hypothetical protein
MKLFSSDKKKLKMKTSPTNKKRLRVPLVIEKSTK